MSRYENQRNNRLNNDNGTFEKTTSFMSLKSPTANSSSIPGLRPTVWSTQYRRINTPTNRTFESLSQLKFDAWVEEDQLNLKSEDESLSIKEKQNFFR